MKKAYMTTTIAAVAGVAVGCSSCVYPTAGYSTYTVPNTVSADAAWTNASYDASGFPIFGYSYGRPVYGYTSTGAAIFTIAALTALCFVPYWGPASWYRGGYYYPHGIHRVPAPPRFPAGHAPGVRPPHGIMPPSGPRPPMPSHFQPVHPNVGPKPPISTMPMPVGGSGGITRPHVSSVPRPGGGTFRPNGSVRFPKPGGVSAPLATVVHPHTGGIPRSGGISTMPMPIPAAGSGTNRPAFYTIPARASSGSVSIPRPVGVSAPPTRIIRSSPVNSGVSASARTLGGLGMPRPH